MPKPGETVTAKVIAQFKDGETRDVTREATIESNTPDLAKVGAAAEVKGERIGEATLLIRYQGKFSTVPVTVLNPKPGFAWNALPQHNYIDQKIDAKLQRLKIQPSPVVDDATFLRRVSLDLTGQIPSPKAVQAFLADPTPSRQKRSKMIDQLIASPAYMDHWTVKWGDLLQSSRKYLGDKGVYAFREWIHDSIAANKPYDKMARELLTARGSSYDDPAANYFRVTRDAEADHGEDHTGLPRRPHGVRPVPRPSLRALDAESVLPDGRLLLRRGPARGLRSRRRDRLRSARRLRDEASEGRPRGAPAIPDRLRRRRRRPDR